MKLYKGEKEAILEAAQKFFDQKTIQVIENDIFLKGKEAGCYQSAWISDRFFISTEYAYEDRIIHNNNTRYKMHMYCVLVKEDPYAIIYDMKQSYYIVCEEKDEIIFSLYHDTLQKITDSCVQLEAIQFL